MCSLTVISLHLQQAAIRREFGKIGTREWCRWIQVQVMLVMFCCVDACGVTLQKNVLRYDSVLHLRV